MELRALQEALEEFIFVAQAHTLGVIERLHREPMSAGELARAMGYVPSASHVTIKSVF